MCCLGPGITISPKNPSASLERDIKVCVARRLSCRLFLPFSCCCLHAVQDLETLPISHAQLPKLLLLRKDADGMVDREQDYAHGRRAMTVKQFLEELSAEVREEYLQNMAAHALVHEEKQEVVYSGHELLRTSRWNKSMCCNNTTTHTTCVSISVSAGDASRTRSPRSDSALSHTS